VSSLVVNTPVSDEGGSSSSATGSTVLASSRIGELSVVVSLWFLVSESSRLWLRSSKAMDEVEKESGSQQARDDLNLELQLADCRDESQRRKKK
jgi:hypothetical protein